ncbi:MAG: glucosyltransferase [Phormidesmis priestleyi]|uniref:Glucosyltransferase n=1 Tax=Phormidesmis priestleyi TaxID=268141 RepID=A0A2W4XA65_9CYAN|nr:MAG: glucosyltransferase [Phormidesmis priestleyi]
MKTRPAKHLHLLSGSSTDIRASRRFFPAKRSTQTKIRGFCLVTSDILSISVAWKLAQFLNQFYSPVPSSFVWWTWLGFPSIFWLFVLFTVALFAHCRLYSYISAAKDYAKAAQLVSYVYLASLVISYFYDPHLDLPRSLFFSAWFSSIVTVVTARLATNALLHRLAAKRQPTTVFIIAPANRLASLSQLVNQQQHYQVVGAAIASTAHSAAVFQSIIRHRPEEVLAEDIPDANLASRLFWQLRSIGIVLRLLPSSREMIYRRGVPEIFASLPTLRIEASFFRGFDYRLKRWLDVCLAAIALLIFLPLFLLIAIAIKLTSPGPAFFCQERTGLHGKVFQVWKFRTMVVNAPHLQAGLEQKNENIDGVMFKVTSDPRVTSVGKFLRCTSLDELPQLFNVLLGQMSLVGPRPLPLRDTALFEPWHHVRHQVLPGITGLWQISGRSTIKSFDDAVRLDLHYIDNWSLNLDLEILLETIKIVCLGKGAY